MDLLARALAATTSEARVKVLLEGSGDIAPQAAFTHVSLLEVTDDPASPVHRVEHAHVCHRTLDPTALDNYFGEAFDAHAAPLAHKVIAQLERTPSQMDLHVISALAKPEDWTQSPLYREVFRPLGIDEELSWFWRLEDAGQLVHAGLCLAAGESPLTDMQRTDAEALLRCLGPLAARTLSRRAAEHSRAGLSPREVDVLELALNGDTEAEIARRLHRSPHTIHSHLRSIYKHFSVTSRAELLAHFIDRES